MKRIISFSGRKGSGKTMLAEACTKYGYNLISFADPIKHLTSKLLNIDIKYLNDHKDVLKPYKITNDMMLEISNATDISQDLISAEFGERAELASIREILQFVGTNIIRKYNPKWHIQQLNSILLANPDKKYCVADTRFLNEKKCLELHLRAQMWFIIRPANRDISNHLSEIELKWIHFNNIIVNDTSKDFLLSSWDKYMTYGELSPSMHIGIPHDKYITKLDAYMYKNPKTAFMNLYFNPLTINLKVADIDILRIHYEILGIDEASCPIYFDVCFSCNIPYNPFIIENLKLWKGFDIPQTVQMLKNEPFLYKICSKEYAV